MKKSPAQEKVRKDAMTILKRQPWFHGICVDNFPSDEACRTNPTQATNDIVMETAYWDAPGGIFQKIV